MLLQYVYRQFKEGKSCWLPNYIITIFTTNDSKTFIGIFNKICKIQLIWIFKIPRKQCKVFEKNDRHHLGRYTNLYKRESLESFSFSQVLVDGEFSWHCGHHTSFQSGALWGSNPLHGAPIFMNFRRVLSPLEQLRKLQTVNGAKHITPYAYSMVRIM